MFFSSSIGIDMGSSNTRVYSSGKGIVFNQPTMVAVRGSEFEVLGMGDGARDLVRCASVGISIMRPVIGGVIADWELAKIMLAGVVKSVSMQEKRSGLKAVLTVPAGITQMERETFEETATAAGLREVCLVESPLVAALGEGLDISTPEGHMIVDVGGGKTEASVVALDGIISNEMVRIGGETMNRRIVDYIRDKTGVVIGESVAEILKINAEGPDDIMQLKGRSIDTGLPANVRVSKSEIKEALAPCTAEIMEMIKRMLQKTAPEMMGDIIQNGVLLTGGGARTAHLKEQLQQMLDLNVRLASAPECSIVTGAGVAMEKMNPVRKIDERQRILAQ
ncbi:MAG: rod shape-determining protein [Eubacteriales bacterium]